MGTLIKNTSGGPKGVNMADGSTVYLAPGEARELDVSEGELASAKALDHFEVGGAAKAKGGSTSLKAEHHGGGKFNITRGEEVLQSGLSKSDADAFNAMTPEEQAAYVKPAE